MFFENHIWFVKTEGQTAELSTGKTQNGIGMITDKKHGTVEKSTQLPYPASHQLREELFKQRMFAKRDWKHHYGKNQWMEFWSGSYSNKEYKTLTKSEADLKNWNYWESSDLPITLFVMITGNPLEILANQQPLQA